MTRIEALRNYMFNVLDNLLKDKEYQINANFLDNNIDNYSLNKIPVEPIETRWITGEIIKQDTYEFTSRRPYSSDVDNNLNNIGFYEKFENVIYSNNRSKILPEIDGIQSIECLNCGALSIANTQDCVFSIQIRITYKEG